MVYRVSLKVKTSFEFESLLTHMTYNERILLHKDKKHTQSNDN